MQFDVEYPDGTTEHFERDVSYYDEEEGTVLSIKRKRELSRVARELIPHEGDAGWAIYGVFVAGDEQYSGDHPYGVGAEQIIVRDEVGRGHATVYAAPMIRDDYARGARFRLAFRDEREEYRAWLRQVLSESAATWDPPSQLEDLPFEEYFEPYLAEGFLFNSTSYEDVIVAVDGTAIDLYEEARDEVLAEAWDEAAMNALESEFGVSVHDPSHTASGTAEFELDTPTSIPGQSERPSALAIKLIPKTDNGRSSRYFGHDVEVWGKTFKVNWLW